MNSISFLYLIPFDIDNITYQKQNKTDNCWLYDFAKILNNKQAAKVIIPKSKFLAEPKLSL